MVWSPSPKKAEGSELRGVWEEVLMGTSWNVVSDILLLREIIFIFL